MLYVRGTSNLNIGVTVAIVPLLHTVLSRSSSNKLLFCLEVLLTRCIIFSEKKINREFTMPFHHVSNHYITLLLTVFTVSTMKKCDCRHKIDNFLC